MSALLQFVGRIAPVLYAIAAVVIFLSLGGIVRAQRTRRTALFGLEREAAQQRRRQAVNTILFMLLMVTLIYTATEIALPNIQGAVVEPTPTPFVFVTQEPTPTAVLLLYSTITPTPGLAPADIPEETEEGGTPVNGCEIFGARITSPSSGQSVTGQVVVEGEANILNFAQYKFELKGTSTGGAWAVVGTFTTAVPEGFLGTWDSTSLVPGNYVLRLVVSRVDGTFPTPCEVPVVLIGGAEE